MRALRYYAPKDLRLDTDVPEPACQPHEIKVRPAFIGICGTDLHEYQHAQNLIPLPGKPHPLTGDTPPIVIGHEFSGVVVEVGKDVTKFGNGEGGIKVGDRVAVQPTLYCRECVPCKQGHTNCCTRNGFLGLSGRGGGLADFVCADADAVFKLPDSVPLEVGALVEPLTVAWHAISISNIKPGDNVLVLGTGPIGLAVIQCLPSFGAGTIIAAEMAGERQVFAKKYGATHLVDPSKEDVVARCHEIGEGYGVEIAFDCAGVEKSLDAATRAVRAKGTVVNLAIWHGKVGFDPNSLVFHEKNYKGSLCFLPSDFGKVVEAIDKGTIKPQDMITRKIALDRVVEDGFEALIHEKDKHVKIMIDMGIGEK